jgi:hypothetical protein
MVMMNQDYRDLLLALNAADVEYLIVPSLVISRTHLISNKKAVGRLQDLADVERLEKKGE